MYSEQAREKRDADLKAKGLDTTTVKASDTVPEGKKGLFGGLIHLPDKNAGANGSSKGKGKVDMSKSGGSGAKGGSTKGTTNKGGSTKGGSSRSGAAAKGGGAGAKGPNRQAPSRTAPAPQNRSKNKKKRK